jgi:hypothetical protein
MKHLKKLILLLPIIFILFFSLSINSQTFAKEWDDVEIDYYIIPRLTEDETKTIQKDIQDIWNKPTKVQDEIRKKANSYTTAQCFNSWIMNRNCIMNYITFVIKFLSQFWLVVWTGFIMYAGYKYMTSVFNSNRTSPEIVKNAIIWVIIVVFSYAIMKTFTSIAWLS